MNSDIETPPTIDSGFNRKKTERNIYSLGTNYRVFEFVRNFQIP